MPIPIPPEIQVPIAQAIGWLWDKYGQPTAEKAARRVVDETKWKFGIEKYYTSLFERVGFVRILGRMESEPLENVFTHVNVLDKLTAEQRYDIKKLKAEFNPRDFGSLERVRRVAGDDAVAEFPKLFILGKPGAGKTTFLKHTALRAIKHEIRKVPLFVSLKELSDSGIGIGEFLVNQLAIHRFPEPANFLARLLEKGDGLILFDGLDEVNLADDKRNDIIRRLNGFIYRYSECLTVITCRVTATDYSFTQFEYVEMADFDAQQMATYIDLWFVGDAVKRQNFKKVLLEDETYKPVRELAQVPLLLALLCLVYEERNEIPPERHEIYEEAMRALLSKWDANRNISRDVVYQQLSAGRKQKMLATIAAKTFEKGDYFLKEKEVVRLIDDYLKGVPGLEDPDAELVLQSLEAQHGIFVERARGIHSFSHLTLQEYFTARYIVDNERQGTVERLIRHAGDRHWDEVFLLVAGMLDDATKFIELFLTTNLMFLKEDNALLALLHWGQKTAITKKGYKPATNRAFLLYLDITHALSNDLVGGHLFEQVRQSTLDLARVLDLRSDLALFNTATRVAGTNEENTLIYAHDHSFFDDHPVVSGLNIKDALTYIYQLSIDVAEQRQLLEMLSILEDFSLPTSYSSVAEWQLFAGQLATTLNQFRDKWDPHRIITLEKMQSERWKGLSREQIKVWKRYVEANALLVRCLQVAYVPDRQALEDKILLPPELW